MLPLQQAYEVKHSILEYLKATFSFKDKSVHEAFYNFINSNESGIFKGPYVSLKLPFVTAKDSENIPLEIKPAFPPYDHQYKAFERLSTRNSPNPRSTLVTTGTSSGKTECFLYPILDYCYQNLDRNGIKVIILYPMNALATDQAKRLAETIWNDSRLKGKITAGLFIGEGKDKKKFPKEMGDIHVIENRDSIIDSPPDILLTNFKMLDYALIRSNYHNLWTYNIGDSSLLKFLVLDELHTYDGAQGTDVANLIRRLKLKLDIPKGQVCAIGTSATIGSGEESEKLLTEYAEKIFGEVFESGSIIKENRQTLDEFFAIKDDELDSYVPRQIGLLESRLKENETYENYILRQKRLWQLPETVNQTQLGDELKKLKLVRDLVLCASNGIIEFDELLRDLADRNSAFKRLSERDNINDLSPREEVINSLLALISEARAGSQKLFPFLYLQIQVWIRELSGVLREVKETPVFTWKDKVGNKYDAAALPSYYCRECGASGWLGVKDDNKNHFYSDPKQVYEYFFGNHKNVYFVNTANHKHIDEYEPNNTITDYINPIDLTLYDKQTENSFKIHAVRKLRETKSRHVCPECNTENSMGIVGTRVATLSSITVSQVLSSDLDFRTEKYRKILAFTNSVQDAAHQAGFVEARNYRFTFRASLQKVINQVNQPLTLVELQNEFIEYWKQHSDESGAKNEEAYYYRFFPSDYTGRVDIDTDYRLGKHFTGSFKKEFDERIKWEVVAEFGHNATIGRTLEKSGASGVKFNERQLEELYPAIKEWLERNNLGVISASDLIPFVNGMLHRIRMRGGIDHEYLSKFRINGVQLWDLNWMRDNRHFLNRLFHPRSRFPKLITASPHNRGILDSTFTNTNNWFKSYFRKSFMLATDHHAIVNDFYRILLKALASTGLMNRQGEDDNQNYSIEPTAVIVENKVKHFECDMCGSVLSVASTDKYTSTTKCLDYACPGMYRSVDKANTNYYQLVYNRNRSPRIYSSEHTGILERKDRENKEFDFKERPHFNSLNTIVATSTLEMGIDIGTLNSAINNSVPPLPSNFLQRVGRAGRASGTALITNFAQAKAHDLFYYEAPKDMMEGDINTPGCYLEAKEILNRHFFAYCLDNWTMADPKNHTIPGRMISLRLLNTDLLSEDFFGNRIITYVKANEAKLLSRFINFYKPDLIDQSVLDNLKAFLNDDSFYDRIRKVFLKLKNEYLNIQQQRKEIDIIIQQNMLAETDEERKSLEAEKRALWGLKRLIDKRSVLEHLTNVGLLPNYAFPETGVTLNAWVKSNKAKASDSIPVDRQFEIVRSSKSAIREFAPDNYFYSQGFKFSISGINTFDWKDPGSLLRKRFCSNCDHIDNASVSVQPNCPKCGDNSWSSAKNQHVFVRLGNVKSVNIRERSKLDDSSDDRDSTRYRISKHIKFDYSTFQGAWGMKDIPFGIEYVKNVDITEVNLGLSSAVDPNKIIINGQEDVPYHGFVTCRYCGKSSSKFRQPDYKFHFGFCKHKDAEYKGASDAIFEEVYLFREIKTEALKVLLPVQEFESESQISMFKAGLDLGLKKYYKGNPEHLSIIDYSEFNSKNSRFDRYLVIHDTIPGGTGYLEKLFSPTEFTEVINKAYLAIKDCQCQSQGKDGCYRCIFTYANQYTQDELSRARAEILFKKIVDKSNAWETFSSGLGTLSGTGQIEESELEDRFIRSLRNFIEKENPSGRFEDFVVDGVINYRFKITNGEYSFYYVIRPQYELGRSEAVKYKTRADFYITLTNIEKNGSSYNANNLLESSKAIAVFLDGYTYHATSENLRFYSDLQKRIAIVDAGDKLSWTLTWNDLEKFDMQEKENDNASKAAKRDFLAFDQSRYSITKKTYEKIPYWNSYKTGIIERRNSFERLIWLLQNPIPENKTNEKIALMLSLRQQTFALPSVDENEIERIISDSSITIDRQLKAKSIANGNFYIFPELPELSDVATFNLAIKVSSLEIKSSVHCESKSSSLDKTQWENFWILFNLVQNNCRLIETTGETSFSAVMADGKYECLANYDVDLHGIIRQLIERNITFENEGSFFLNPNNPFPEAVLGFRTQKLFIRPLSEDDKKAFQEAGYKEIDPFKFNIEDFN
jgi:DEAD/DEAH box helicase domain-containing protein